MFRLDKILQEYRSLKLSEIIDYDKYNDYAITHHSTTIEGSTLSEIETRLLLDEGITPSGKPLLHSLMVKDHDDALRFVISAADQKRPISIEFIKEMNARVMRNTGALYNTVLGNVDSSKGDFRLGNVFAGGKYFVSFEKVPELTRHFVANLQDNINQSDNNIESQLRLSFAAHYDLVNIHPFYDGNGRTSRLLMNFIQRFYALPLAIVYAEDRAAYLAALIEAGEKKKIDIFFNFMFAQYEKYLLAEISKFRLKDENITAKRRGFGLSIFLG